MEMAAPVIPPAQSSWRTVGADCRPLIPLEEVEESKSCTLEWKTEKLAARKNICPNNGLAIPV